MTPPPQDCWRCHLSLQSSFSGGVFPRPRTTLGVGDVIPATQSWGAVTWSHEIGTQFSALQRPLSVTTQLPEERCLSPHSPGQRFHVAPGAVWAPGTSHSQACCLPSTVIPRSPRVPCCLRPGLPAVSCLPATAHL